MIKKMTADKARVILAEERYALNFGRRKGEEGSRELDEALELAIGALYHPYEEFARQEVPYRIYDYFEIKQTVAPEIEEECVTALLDKSEFVINADFIEDTIRQILESHGIEVD